MQTPAIEALSRLYLEVSADLDPDGGGIRWMRDQLDWQRASLIGNYFMSAISGVQSSLNAAANAAKRYRQREYTDNQWISSQWGKTRKRGVRRLTTSFATYREIQRRWSEKLKCSRPLMIVSSIWCKGWTVWLCVLQSQVRFGSNF